MRRRHPLVVELLEDRCTPSTTVIPEPIAGLGVRWWDSGERRNQALIARGHADVLFLGDSITYGLANGVGQAVWQRDFAPLQSVSFAIPGLTAQQVLWQVDSGEVRAVSPKVVVLMVGVNNLGTENDQAGDVIAGVQAIVNGIHEQLPDTHILLLGILPFGQNPDAALVTRWAATNAGLAELSDGNNISYLDIGNHFVESDGHISNSILSDYVHPTALGYERYAAAVLGPLHYLLVATEPVAPAPPASVSPASTAPAPVGQVAGFDAGLAAYLAADAVMIRDADQDSEIASLVATDSQSQASSPAFPIGTGSLDTASISPDGDAGMIQQNR